MAMSLSGAIRVATPYMYQTPLAVSPLTSITGFVNFLRIIQQWFYGSAHDVSNHMALGKHVCAMPMIDKFLSNFLPARHPQFFSPLTTGPTGVIYDDG